MRPLRPALAVALALTLSSCGIDWSFPQDWFASRPAVLGRYELAIQPETLGLPRAQVVARLGEPHERRKHGVQSVEIYAWKARPAQRRRGARMATHLRVDGRLVPIRAGTRLLLQYGARGQLTGYAVSASAG